MSIARRVEATGAGRMGRTEGQVRPSSQAPVDQTGLERSTAPHSSTTTAPHGTTASRHACSVHVCICMHIQCTNAHSNSQRSLVNGRVQARLSSPLTSVLFRVTKKHPCNARRQLGLAETKLPAQRQRQRQRQSHHVCTYTTVHTPRYTHHGTYTTYIHTTMYSHAPRSTRHAPPPCGLHFLSHLRVSLRFIKSTRVISRRHGCTIAPSAPIIHTYVRTCLTDPSHERTLLGCSVLGAAIYAPWPARQIPCALELPEPPPLHLNLNRVINALSRIRTYRVPILANLP